MNHRVVFLAFLWSFLASPVLADQLRTGLWILELKRSDAPLDRRKIAIHNAEGKYHVKSATNSEQENPISAFKIEGGVIFFRITEVEMDCRLDPDPVAAATWGGSCPPGAATGADGSLQVVMRPPIGIDADSDEEDSAETDASQTETVPEADDSNVSGNEGSDTES